MAHRGKGGDKRTQYWSAIEKEKLDTLKYIVLHSDVNVATLQDDDGFTGLQVAAAGDKHKALLLMLDLLRSKREIKEAIDIADDAGRTAIMLAAARGHTRCVDHLIYYGASLSRKSSEGCTARDYAARGKHKDVLELIDDELAPPEAPSAAAAEAVDADGLTSTQRSKLKKAQLREKERSGMVAAVTAAAASTGGDDEAPTAAGSATSSAAAATPGLPALGAMPVAIWPEVKAVYDDKRRELNIHRSDEVVGPEGGDAPPPPPPLPDGVAVDPALWHCVLLNRLELRVPRFTELPPLVGHLTALQTLILAGNGLTALPDALEYCTELKFLDVGRNALTALPEALGKLKKLEVLNAAENAITSTAPIAGLTTLTALSLDHNAITELALNLAGLARLATLSVSNNKLTALPEDWSGLASLAVLNVSDNEIEELPAGMAELPEKKIRDMKLLPNPIADKKVLKILNSDRPEKVVKELFKHLAANAGGGGKGKGKKGR